MTCHHALQSTAFSNAVTALPTTAPSTAPANGLPALGAALTGITPLFAKAAQCSAISAALSALRTEQGSPLFNGTAADVARCVRLEATLGRTVLRNADSSTWATPALMRPRCQPLVAWACAEQAVNVTVLDASICVIRRSHLHMPNSPLLCAA